MGGYAWVTLATNDSYSLGALVLAHSLKQVGTKQQLAVLITPGVTTPMRTKLNEVFNLVKEVNILDSKDETNLRLLKRPELGVTFTKLHCWRLTQYEKCVFLDADTLVLENCDELFQREEFSAAPDIGWPDCFNSGVFVYRPSNETFDKLIQFAIEKGSFDGGDQGLLNLYFSDWAHKDISKHLPFIYNMSSTATYSYLPAFKQYGGNMKIIHFIGSTKPWLQYFDTESKRVRPSDDVRHLEVILQRWWDIFCSMIHPGLSQDMTGIAGAFAKLTLGVPRTPEQAALDDHLRRQGWEVGNIDYLGRDSFDNIWSKICETLSSPESAPKPTEPSPPETTVESTKEPPVQADKEAPVSQMASTEVTPGVTPVPSQPSTVPGTQSGSVAPEPVPTPEIVSAPVTVEPKTAAPAQSVPIPTSTTALVLTPTPTETPVPILTPTAIAPLDKPLATEAPSVPTPAVETTTVPPVTSEVPSIAPAAVVAASAESTKAPIESEVKVGTDSEVIPTPVAEQIVKAASEVVLAQTEAPVPLAPVSPVQEKEILQPSIPVSSTDAPTCPLSSVKEFSATTLPSKAPVICPPHPKESTEAIPTSVTSVSPVSSKEEPASCPLLTKEISATPPPAEQISASPLPETEPAVCPLPKVPPPKDSTPPSKETPAPSSKGPTPPSKEPVAPITPSKEPPAPTLPSKEPTSPTKQPAAPITPSKEPAAPTPSSKQLTSPSKEPVAPTPPSKEPLSQEPPKESCPLPAKELPVSPPPSKESPVCPLPPKESAVIAPTKKSKEPVTIPKAQVTEPTPPATPSAVQSKLSQQLPGEATPEVAPDTSATGPTPPPRKGSGGTKKAASKKK